MAHGDIWNYNEAIFSKDPLLLSDESQADYADGILRHLLINRTMNAFSPTLLNLHDQDERDKFLWRDVGSSERLPEEVIGRYKKARLYRNKLDESDRDKLKPVTMVSNSEYTKKRKKVYASHDTAVKALKAKSSRIDRRLRIAAVGYRVQVSKVPDAFDLDEELCPQVTKSSEPPPSAQIFHDDPDLGRTKAASPQVVKDWEAAILAHVKKALSRGCHFIILPEFALPPGSGGDGSIEDKIYTLSNARGLSDHFIFAGSRHEGVSNKGLVVARSNMGTSRPWWHGKVAPSRALGENILGPYGTKRPSYAALFQITEDERPNFPIDIAICYDSFDPTMFLALVLQSRVSTDDEIRPRMMLVPSFNTSKDFVALLRDLSFVSRSIVVYVNGLHGDAKMYICGFAVADFNDRSRLTQIRSQLSSTARQLSTARQRILEQIRLPPEALRTSGRIFKKIQALETLNSKLDLLEQNSALDHLITVQGHPSGAAIKGRYDPSDLLYYNIDMALINALFNFRTDYFGGDAFLPKPFQYDELKVAAVAMRKKILEEEKLRSERYAAHKARC
jgi:hypothetical protein